MLVLGKQLSGDELDNEWCGGLTYFYHIHVGQQCLDNNNIYLVSVLFDQ